MDTVNLYQNPLFAGVPTQDLEELIWSLNVRCLHYEKGQIIFHTGDIDKHIGILLRGKVQILQRDHWGNESLLAKLSGGEIFAESFACSSFPQILVEVSAIEAAEVLFTSYERLASSPHAQLLLHNLVTIIADKNSRLTQRMSHVSKRTIREKLLSYFASLRMQSKSNRILLPMQRQQLADYLCTDRSALSRELSNMQKEGIITLKKNTVTLHPF